ncbi:MAG: hypothetical protein NTX50_28955 [Candidatus Sumerlaeota bacterium]|nr:hypothetical protein [Candidatus Sumerlaeota bacterium]
MSVKDFRKKAVNADRQALGDIIANELKQPSEDRNQPVIIIEGPVARGSIHVFVVYDEWQDLTPLERSETIMDALEDAWSSEEVINVTVAMGLTTAEADRMSLQYR